MYFVRGNLLINLDSDVVQKAFIHRQKCVRNQFQFILGAPYIRGITFSFQVEKLTYKLFVPDRLRLCNAGRVCEALI